MVTDGSKGGGRGVGPVAGVALLLVGFGAMQGVAVLTAPLGMRPMFLLAETALVLPGLLYLLVRGLPIAPTLGLFPPGRRLALLALGLGLTLWIASLGLLETQSLVWAPSPEYLEMFRRLHEALKPRDLADALFSIAAIALVPALCEETLVRGIVLPPLARALGGALGVLVSALLFAAIHYDAYRFAFTFAVGLALGLLRLRTGSLIPGILSHALLNTITFAAAPWVDDPTGTETASAPLALALLGVGALLSAGLMRSARKSDA
jgi:membrane protease YdiL (CAAX protease family)